MTKIEKDNKPRFLISNFYRFYVYFIGIIFWIMMIKNFIENYIEFFYVILPLVLWLLLFIIFFCYYKIYDNYIERKCLFWIKKREILFYGDIKKIIYSTVDANYDGPKIKLIHTKGRYLTIVKSLKKRQKLLLFFKSKKIPIEIETNFEKDKEILYKEIKPGFFYRKLPFLFGDRGIF